MYITVGFGAFILIFLVLVEFFAILLRLTGIEHDKARFQVISLLTSTGYTTKEAEIITNHPGRRKLAEFIMIFGFASSVTFLSLVVNLIMSNSYEVFKMLLIICLWIFVLKLTNLLEIIEEIISNLIRNNKIWKKFIGTKEQIITKNRGYGIMEIYLDGSSVLIGKDLISSGLKKYEIQVLNIDKGNKLIAFPQSDYLFEANDLITVYGNIENISDMFGENSKKRGKNQWCLEDEKMTM